MASANVELVRSIYSAWERGDFSSSSWADVNIEFVRVDGPAPGTWSGSAEISGAVREMLSAWHDFRIVADAYHELDDDRVLVLVHARGRGKRSGIDFGPVGAGRANLFHVTRGKVTRLVTYYDRDRALAEFGVTPDA